MAFLSGIIGIFAGRITDKYGGRMIGIICAITVGGGFLLLSQLASLGNSTFTIPSSSASV
jgi:hypothetical protein